MSSPRTIFLLGLALVLAACSSEGKETRAANDDPQDGTSRPEDPEPEGEPEPNPETDAGADPEGPVPLTVWVDDLIEARTSDQAQPDSVDDKHIVDDTTPESFDKYLN